MADPFVLLDDARPDGASAARLYRNPREIISATRAEDVAGALTRIDAAHRGGAHLAGFLAYEAGLMIEPRLVALAPARSGAAGPLVWFGVFDSFETLAPGDVPAWLVHDRDQEEVRIGPLEPQISLGGYQAAFTRLQQAITAGDIYQANLTLPLAGPWQGDPLALYAALRPGAAAGYGGIIHDGSHWLLSFSPELFFAARDEALLVKPMKGTRPRGATPQDDARLHADLAASAKDRAENLMIVDLLRNDLSRVAAPGSVQVEAPFAIESYPTVHQMTTTIRASLLPDHGVADVLRALFPCGSITGAPKIRAMELIDAVERDPRGPYCGALGRIDPPHAQGSGEAAFNVAIRTLRLTPDRNPGTGNAHGTAVLGVGSAIVADSDGMAEWRECLVKGGFVRKVHDRAGQAPCGPVGLAAARCDLIETMRFTPEEGIVLLDLHLERMKASAAELGFVFDRHAIRNAIQALCFDAEQAAMLRLKTSQRGAFSLELAPLPPPADMPVDCIALPLPVDPGDWRLRHKTSDRGFYDLGQRAARGRGAFEAVLVRDDGLVTEGCITSVFVERDGTLLTPPLAQGLLPGVLRRSLLDSGRAREANLSLRDLADGFLIGNALRGLMPARLI